MDNFFSWWAQSNGALVARGVLLAGLFGGLALWDWRRHGPAARRWREYLFLLAATATAMLYGLANDQVTVTISPEYIFHHAHEMRLSWLPEGPDDPVLRLTAVEMGLKATWAAGLVLGAAVLTANNVLQSRRPMLATGRLYRLLPGVLAWTLAGGVVVGLIGGWGGLAGFFPPEWGELLEDPRRFESVWGVHAGGYLGALAGGVWAVRAVWRRRGQ